MCWLVSGVELSKVRVGFRDRIRFKVRVRVRFQEASGTDHSGGQSSPQRAEWRARE